MGFLECIGNILTIKEVGQYILAPFMKKRADLLKEVILSEMREGDFSHVHKDEVISICYRLTRDAMEGVAKNNLRLMARLICGLNAKNKLTASTFQKYSKILADLSEDEIHFLAELYNALKEQNCSEKEIMEEMRSKNGHILFGLIRTGFLIPLQPEKGMVQVASDINLWLPSPKLKELYSLWNWEDVAQWKEDDD